ncbi:hypothetical protein Baya_11911 [Bagarius yarrelli]|uniref:Uncharacterized protein n=1 Tax=Bagarius yarrelli TaxID=175774 RepID=A0A556V1T8_BAGYA|nr:hypothetical protein Baya_11911 [Bagarius yarrelli]
MPQLARLEVRELNGCRKGEDQGGIEDGARQEQKHCWKNVPHWGQCPGAIRCLVPVLAALWLVIPEENFPYFLKDEGWWLLTGMLFTGLLLYLGSLLKFLYQYCKQYKRRKDCEKSEIFGDRTGQPHQACSEQDAGPLLFMVRALLDGLVVSLLQEPVSDPRVSQIQGLISKLETISQFTAVAANNNVSIEEQGLQTNNNEDKVLKTKLEDRVKNICTYLQKRASDLHCLLQTQDQYGVCIASVQQELLEYWELLEDLHTKVTLQPEMGQEVEVPHTVLTDTESLYTKLGLFQSRIHECQGHLSTSTHLLEELEVKQQDLAQTMALTVESAWTKDLLQCNTQQFEKVSKDFTSLSQQTLTFVMHLKDLSVSKEKNGIKTSDVKHVHSSSLPLSAVPVYSIVPATEKTPSDPDLDSTNKPSSKFSVLSLLCGLRQRR